jgi:L-ascorbate metabolism protein UlaG (beta-lactamase superfamily)
MKTFILFIFLLTYTVSGYSQHSNPDQVEASGGPITIQPIFHSTLMLKWMDKIIYVDPYGGVKAFDGLPSPNLILITDIHGDHMNIETLSSIDISRAILVVPTAVSDVLPDEMKSKLVVLDNNENTKLFGIHITTVPMYNLPETSDSRHPKGRGNGYILTLGEKRIYISGDTEDIPEMRALKNIDIAFICMNQPFTMTIEQAADAVLDFKPTIVYPFHFRGQGGFSDVSAFKKLVQKGNAIIDVRLLNWYPTY